MKSITIVKAFIPEEAYFRMAEISGRGGRHITCPECDGESFRCTNDSCGKEFKETVFPSEEKRTWDTVRIIDEAFETHVDGYMKESGKKIPQPNGSTINEKVMDWGALTRRAKIHEIISAAKEDEKEAILLEDAQYDEIMKSVDRWVPGGVLMKYLIPILMAIKNASDAELPTAIPSPAPAAEPA